MTAAGGGEGGSAGDKAHGGGENESSWEAAARQKKHKVAKVVFQTPRFVPLTVREGIPDPVRVGRGGRHACAWHTTRETKYRIF